MEQNTEYLYYGCNWIIRYLHDYRVIDFIVDTANALNCRLVEIKDVFTARTEGHQAILQFIIRVPSPEALNEFVLKAGQKIGLTEWHPASVQDYSKGRIF